MINFMFKKLFFIIFFFVFVNSLIPLFVNSSRVYAFSETTFYIHQDNLGSVVAVTNQDGDVVSQMDYSSYGNSVGDDFYVVPNQVGQTLKSVPTERSYTGQIKDTSTSLQYYNARYYDPILSRFISADQVQGGNRYAYVGNNPISFSDPTGNMKTDEGGDGIRPPQETGQKIKHFPSFNVSIEANSTYNGTRWIGSDNGTFSGVALPWTNERLIPGMFDFADIGDPRVVVGGLYLATQGADAIAPYAIAGGTALGTAGCRIGFAPACGLMWWSTAMGGVYVAGEGGSLNDFTNIVGGGYMAGELGAGAIQTVQAIPEMAYRGLSRLSSLNRSGIKVSQTLNSQTGLMEDDSYNYSNSVRGSVQGQIDAGWDNVRSVGNTLSSLNNRKNRLPIWSIFQPHNAWQRLCDGGASCLDTQKIATELLNEQGLTSGPINLSAGPIPHWGTLVFDTNQVIYYGGRVKPLERVLRQLEKGIGLGFSP